MNRTTLKVTLLVISLLAFQFGLLNPFIPDMQVNQAIHTVFAIPAPVGSSTPFSVDANDTMETFDIPIIEPGVYRINLTFTVDSGLPAPGPDASVEYYQTSSMWIPQIGGMPQLSIFDSSSWSNVPENDTRSRELEVIAAQSGSFRIEFQITGTSSGDQVSGNLAVYQELAFSTLPNASPLGQNSTLHFTQDYTWMGLRINMPIHDLYNISTYSKMDWSTTAGWPGDGSFNPLDGVILVDPYHGDQMPYGTWNPSFNVPLGPDTNSTTWGPAISRQILDAGDYYLIGKSEDFEFLNGSYVDFTINIASIPTQVLLPSVPLQLSFNTTPNVYDNYIAVVIPEGHYFNMYYSSPIGHNWSVGTSDGWTGSYTGPYFETYESPTSSYDFNENLELGWATAMGGMAPMPGVLGDPYTEMWQADAAWGIYTNGTKGAAIPPSGMVATSRFNTFYYRAYAFPSGEPSTTFRININFEITPFPELTTSGLTFDFNSTIGPFYHIFQVPQTSGAVYKVSALATSYTSTGTIHLEEMVQPRDYENWQWTAMVSPPLAFADPPFGVSPPSSRNTNDTATLTYVAVKDGINYLWIKGPGMIGGDMTEGTVSLEVTPPIPYALGTVATVAVNSTEFVTVTFNVEAGTTYYLEFTLRPDGDTAYGSFFNIFGYSPFIISSYFQLFVVAGPTMPFGLTYRATFTAQHTGRVSFVVRGSTSQMSTASFFIGAVIPWTSTSVIAALVATAIIMIVVGSLVGYFIARRRFKP